MRPSDGATVPWSDLEFPGRRPKRAGAGQYPFCPPGGYAGSRLRGWNPRRPVSELLALFLDDFLKQNGYHAIGNPVADTIEAATASETSTRTHPDALAVSSPQDHDDQAPAG